MSDSFKLTNIKNWVFRYTYGDLIPRNAHIDNGKCYPVTGGINTTPGVVPEICGRLLRFYAVGTFTKNLTYVFCGLGPFKWSMLPECIHYLLFPSFRNGELLAITHLYYSFTVYFRNIPGIYQVRLVDA